MIIMIIIMRRIIRIISIIRRTRTRTRIRIISRWLQTVRETGKDTEAAGAGGHPPPDTAAAAR